MAGLGTDHRGQTATSVNSFQQTLLTNYLRIAVEKSNLVARQLFEDHTRFYDGKSTTFTFPKGGSMSATAYVEGTPVTYQDPADSEVTISLDKQYESSLLYSEFRKRTVSGALIESDLQQIAYAINKQIDSHILANYSSLTLTTEAATTDTGDNLYTHVVDAVGKLDIADIPEGNRVLLIHPVLKTRFLNTNKFVSIDYIKNEYPVKTGLIGELFGIPVYVSTNVPATTVSGTTTYHNILADRSAFGYVMSIQPKIYGPVKVGQYIGDSLSAIAQYGTGVINAGRGLTLTCTAT